LARCLPTNEKKSPAQTSDADVTGLVTAAAWPSIVSISVRPCVLAMGGPLASRDARHVVAQTLAVDAAHAEIFDFEEFLDAVF
jgi:hypothetical protein